MKVKVQQADLLKGLERIIDIIPQTMAFPVLENVLVSTLNGKLTLAATDLNTYASTQINAQIYKKGEILVPGKLVIDTVREIPQTELQLTSNQDMHIENGNSSYQITGTPVEEYTPIMEVSNKGSIRLDAKSLHKMIYKTTFAVSRDGVESFITGALLQIQPKEMRMIGTDGSTLAFMKLSGNYKTEEEIKVTVPHKALDYLGKIMENSKVNDVEARFEEGRIGFYFDNTTITTASIEAQFPDYEQEIPEDNDKVIYIKKDSLISALKRAGRFSNPHTHEIQMNLNKDLMEILSGHPDKGKAKERLPAIYDGKEVIEIKFNSNYLLDILERIEDDEVKMSFSKPLGASIITPTEQKKGEELLYLLMPIKDLDTD